MKLSTQWKNLRAEQREKIVDAWQDTFAMFAIVLMVGVPLLNWAYSLPSPVCLCADLLGIASMLMTGALSIWRRVFIEWDWGDEDG